MKFLLIALMLIVSCNVFSQRVGDIDNFNVIDLNLSVSATDVYSFRYVNYPISGLRPDPRRATRDCLLLDLQANLQGKINFANEIKVMVVRKNRGLPIEIRELAAEIIDNSVVFYFEKGSQYITFIQVKTRDGSNLNKVIARTLQGASSNADLIYSRECNI